MKELSHLQQDKDNIAKFLFCTGILYVLLPIFPQYFWFSILTALIIAFIFIVRPLLGVFFVIAVHPIMTCSFELFWTFNQPVDILGTENFSYVKLTTPMTAPLSIFPFQIASFLLLPSLFFHSTPLTHRHIGNTSERLMCISIFFFFIWGLIVALSAVYPDKALFGLSRFLSIAIIICYLVRFADTPEILRKIMTVYSCAAVWMSFSAYYSTYYGFENITSIFADYGLRIIQRQALFNTAGGFNPEQMGLLPGFGLGGKHEFATCVSAGLIFSFHLLATEKNKLNSIYYLITILFLYPALYYAPSKLALLGITFGVLLVVLLSQHLRKYIAVFALLLILLNSYGLAVSGYLRPEHAKKMAGTTQNFKVINNSSEFEGGMQGRKAIWRSAVKTIIHSKGVGIGPDMLNQRLNHDIGFAYPHAHNIFLGILAEYGFPGLICFIILGVLLTRQVIPIIIRSKYEKENAFYFETPLTICFLSFFIEYNFDCIIWIPQLWIVGSLLWITGTNGKINSVTPINLKQDDL